MKKIQMVDLKGQYQPIKEQVNQSIQEVIDTTAFINGPQVHEFQKELEEYLNVKHVIPCANGTDALQIAMMGLGLKPGDEVITADFTFAATVEVIALLQLTPVLVDVDPIDFNIDIEAIKKAITPKTKAIVPVHLFGKAANMDAILEIAEEHDLFVIEDNAQAIGANYTHKDGKKVKTGAIGHVGSTSFFPSKNLGCYGDGGAIFTNDDDLAQKIKMIVNHGEKIKYHHEIIGCNSRLDSIQAEILNIKLKYLDEYNSNRKVMANIYNQALNEIDMIKTPKVISNSDHVYHQYTLRILNGERDKLRSYLDDLGIPSMIYYPIPIHRQKPYKNRQNLDYTDLLSKEVISLPIHSEYENSNQDYIIKMIRKFFDE